MSTETPLHPDRFRFLATFLAARSLDVLPADDGETAYTDGRSVFVRASACAQVQRREVVVQSALLAAGSLEQEFVKALRGRPKLARRYLALEGCRVCAQLARQLPLAATLCPAPEPLTSSADESLSVAKSWKMVTEPPEWFGTIRPSRLLAAAKQNASEPDKADFKLEFDLTDAPESEDSGEGDHGERSKILSLLDNPLLNSNTLSDFFYKMFGMSRAPGEGEAGGDMQVRAIRKVASVGPNAKPLPVPLRISGGNPPGAAAGVGGSLFPEWDVHKNQYRPQWCRVIDYPLTTAADISASGVQKDEVLRQRLTKLGLGPKVIRGQPDGEDLDVEAMIDLYIDLKTGFSPPENIYLERRKLARNLGVLILVDASGSATDTDPDGLSVHEHQRRAAATIAVTLEELGDRVAVYGFRSHGRSNVHLMGLKPFAQRFGAGGRARLNQLEPAGYTRLGAGIRGAGEILKAEAGTPNRLLLVLSDGFPYDDGYEARYAEADAHKALDELRDDGVACLCLSIGTTTPSEALDRVFGSASYASADQLSELSPRMDQLFLSALQELSVSNPRGPR